MSALASMIVGSLIGLLAFPVLVGAFAALLRHHPACRPVAIPPRSLDPAESATTESQAPTAAPTSGGGGKSLGFVTAAAVEVRAEDLAVVRTLVRRKHERLGVRLRWLEQVRGSLDVVG